MVLMVVLVVVVMMMMLKLMTLFVLLFQNVVAERNRKSSTLTSPKADNPPPGGLQHPSSNGDSKEEEPETPEEEKEKANSDEPITSSLPSVLTPEITKVIAGEEKEVPVIHSTPNSEEVPMDNSMQEAPAKVTECTGQDGEVHDIPVPKHQGVVPSNRVLFRVGCTGGRVMC